MDTKNNANDVSSEEKDAEMLKRMIEENEADMAAASAGGSVSEETGSAEISETESGETPDADVSEKEGAAGVENPRTVLEEAADEHVTPAAEEAPDSVEAAPPEAENTDSEKERGRGQSTGRDGKTAHRLNQALTWLLPSVRKHIRADGVKGKSSGKRAKSARVRANIAWGFLIAIAFLGTIIPCSVHWALAQFANLRMDEMIYELTAPLEGTGNGMIGSYIRKCLVPAILVSGACVAAGILWKKRKYFTRIALSGIAAGVAVIAVSVNVFGNSTDMWSYIKNAGVSSDFIEQNYVNPADTEITFPENKRNLIYIYLESMEISFSDKENGGAYDTNYIPELTKLAEQNEDFSGSSGTLNGGYSMPGTTWTVAGMFAQSSGLPLKTSIDDNAMSSQSTFFPGITILGDILEQNGYTQELMVGSDASFGGRRLLYTQHGDFNIFDLIYARETGLLPSDYYVFWGFEDDKLFEYAKDELTKLGSGDEPFNFTMLTEDTHFPDGYTSPSYAGKYDSAYANALSCSSEQVADFISWCMQQDWFENTTIILNGDHPTMSTFSDSIPSDYTRKTYTCYINAAAEPTDPERTRVFTTFDAFPTTLAAIGCSIEDERLGLGTNLFSDTDTYTEIYGYETVSDELSKQSDFISSIEKLDDADQEIVDYYADTVPEINYTAGENGSLSFTLRDADLAGATGQSFGVKIWAYIGGNYVHSTIPLEKQEDGSWSVTIDMATAPGNNYQNVEKFYYQIMTYTDTAQGLSVGPQGELDLTREYVNYVPAESGAESAAVPSEKVSDTMSN